MTTLKPFARAACLTLALTLAGTGAARAQDAFRPRGPSPLRVLGYALGGAIVGSWTGYVASQVTWSDWSDATGRSAHRIRYSVAGAAMGMVTGLVIGNRRPGYAPLSPPPPHLAPPLPNRSISEEEIRGSSARTVTEVIRRLRPQWLRARGRDIIHADSLHLNQDPLAVPGVRVYLNDNLLGGLDALDEVAVDAVTGVSFLDGNAAVLRFGTGNGDGAILLSTRPGV